MTKRKRIEALKEAAKKSPNYLGELKTHPIYNIWRTLRFTKKGKKAGSTNEWKNFKRFYKDILPSYEAGKRFCRKDTSKPFSIDNFIFLTDEESSSRNYTPKLLEYKEEVKPLEEWAIEFDLPMNALRQRYYKGLKYKHSAERILFGYRYAKRREPKDHRQLSKQKIRDKASKMIASYNNTDKKKGFSKGDLEIDWFIENIFNKNCSYCGHNQRMGADRVNNNENHSKKNTVPCCYECNVARNNIFSHQEMKIIGSAIAKVRKNRKK